MMPKITVSTPTKSAKLNVAVLRMTEALLTMPARSTVHPGEGLYCVCDTPRSASVGFILPGMNAVEQQAEFLNLKISPARLNASQAAWYLGFEPHEITILASTGLLKPLGHPARNATKFFATAALEQLRRDEKWLIRATDAVAAYWKEGNARKRSACGRGEAKMGKAIRRVAPVAAKPAAPPAATAAAGTE
ncbi:MAG: hypothetical protein NT154_28570 [Verrucomicrobia bacterium]|nr:hypothetical protein [Verrucomicrobiota bacterium]